MPLRSFHQPRSVVLPQPLIEKADAFADAVVLTVDYRDSNQTLRAKIRQDHFVSKLGEAAVRMVFEALGHQVKGPDYRVYAEEQKSWAADLLVDDLELAVKTQTHTAARKYGLSWTFQCSPQRRDPILDQPLAWVCFALLHDEACPLRCTVFPPCQIQDLTFREPKLLKLQGKKKVVYAQDPPLKWKD